jgi:hypothetical protein
MTGEGTVKVTLGLPRQLVEAAITVARDAHPAVGPSAAGDEALALVVALGKLIEERGLLGGAVGRLVDECFGLAAELEEGSW